MKGLKSIIFGAAALIALPVAFTACDDWTEPEANDYYKPLTPGYFENLKDYFASPHQKMFGWFGSWAAGAKGNQLIGLPDSVDFVSLWLCWGNLTEEQQADLKAFQERGSKAVLCWLPTAIGENITPGGNSAENLEAFWGFTDGDVESRIEAAKKYADAIADTCFKYGIDGFDADIESQSSLIDQSEPRVFNEFMRQLRRRFDEKPGMLLVADIPGGTGWLGYYRFLDDDVVQSLDYIVWQTYELNHSGMTSFFDAVKSYKPDLFDEVLAKSIITATFERAADKYLFASHATWRYSDGRLPGGIGAYHIEYDYPGNPDYPTVRAGISTMNPPINN